MPRHMAAVLAIVQVLFISIPLLVYVLAFTIFLPHHSFEELARKPEWMFIALMLEAEAVRQVTIRSAAAPEVLRDNLALVQMLLLLLFAIVLVIVLARYEGVLVTSFPVEKLQWLFLAMGVFSCWSQKYQHYRGSAYAGVA
jgi:hypothetical protein